MSALDTCGHKPRGSASPWKPCVYLCADLAGLPPPVPGQVVMHCEPPGGARGEEPESPQEGPASPQPLTTGTQCSLSIHGGLCRRGSRSCGGSGSSTSPTWRGGEPADSSGPSSPASLSGITSGCAPPPRDHPSLETLSRSRCHAPKSVLQGRIHPPRPTLILPCFDFRVLPKRTSDRVVACPVGPV